MSIERRCCERVEVFLLDQHDGGHLPVWLFGTHEQAVLSLMVDISETGGRFLISKESPLPRLGLAVVITAIGEEKIDPLEIRAEKLWSRTDMSLTHNVMGCRYHNLPDHIKARLSELIQKLKEMPDQQYVSCELIYDESQDLYKDSEFL